MRSPFKSEINRENNNNKKTSLLMKRNRSVTSYKKMLIRSIGSTRETVESFLVEPSDFQHFMYRVGNAFILFTLHMFAFYLRIY